MVTILLIVEEIGGISPRTVIYGYETEEDYLVQQWKGLITKEKEDLRESEAIQICNSHRSMDI